MTSSATYSFGPSVADFTLNAFARLQIRRPELTTQHLTDAAMEANLVQVQMSNLQPNLWRSELYTQVLTASDGNYVLPARMIAIIAAYISTDNGDSTTTDRIIGPLSAYEYAAISTKSTEAPPTSFWYDRQITPQINLWPIPDDAQTYTLKLRILSQVQDASLPSGVTPDLPYRFFDAFSSALAHRLARIYKPELEMARKVDAKEAWDIAANQDTEAVPMFIIPCLSVFRGY